MNQEETLGVALTKEVCRACMTEMDGDLVMNKRLNKSQAKAVKAMHGQVTGWADKFCDECEGYSKLGIILVTVDSDKSEDNDNPYRTGGFFVLKVAAVKRLLKDQKEMLKNALEHRMMYIDHNIAVELGLFKNIEDEQAKQD